MELTPEKQATNGTLLYPLPNNGYLKIICVSNKEIFLETMLKNKKYINWKIYKPANVIIFFVFRNSSYIFF